MVVARLGCGRAGGLGLRADGELRDRSGGARRCGGDKGRGLVPTAVVRLNRTNTRGVVGDGRAAAPGCGWLVDRHAPGGRAQHATRLCVSGGGRGGAVLATVSGQMERGWRRAHQRGRRRAADHEASYSSASAGSGCTAGSGAAACAKQQAPRRVQQLGQQARPPRGRLPAQKAKLRSSAVGMSASGSACMSAAALPGRPPTPACIMGGSHSSSSSSLMLTCSSAGQGRGRGEDRGGG